MARQFMYYRVRLDDHLRCALCTLTEGVDQDEVTISFLDPVAGRCYRHHSETYQRLPVTIDCTEQTTDASLEGCGYVSPYRRRRAAIAKTGLSALSARSHSPHGGPSKR
jgi:hypothetical protein